MKQYTKPQERLFKVWDSNKQEWWIPPESKKYNAPKKRMRDLWTGKHYAEASVKRQLQIATQWLSNPKNKDKPLPEDKYAPANYIVVEFCLVEVVND